MVLGVPEIQSYVSTFANRIFVDTSIPTLKPICIPIVWRAVAGGIICVDGGAEVFAFPVFGCPTVAWADPMASLGSWCGFAFSTNRTVRVSIFFGTLEARIHAAVFQTVLGQGDIAADAGAVFPGTYVSAFIATVVTSLVFLAIASNVTECDKQ